ncbi:hypothetical protein L195_g064289, partial [Trifolium pratense]
MQKLHRFGPQPCEKEYPTIVEQYILYEEIGR